MKKTDKIDIFTIITIGILAFGSQIVWLGFFQDDWNFVYYSSVHGAQGLFEFLILDGRPGATWVYALGFSLFEYQPALWQIFSISLRIFTAINFLFVLKRLWPDRRYGNLITCVFFLTYPFFTLQPLSVAYAPHFASYLLYSLSILFMIWAIEKPEKYVLYFTPGVLATFLQLFTVEYFIGLEILRPVIIWILLSKGTKDVNVPKLQKTFALWLPYLIILIFFIMWRSGFSADLGIRNNPITVLFNSSEIISSVARNALADLALMLVSSWFKLIDPELLVIGPIRNFYILAITLIGGSCFYFLAKPANQTGNNAAKTTTIFLAGILIYIAGMAATYIVGFIVHLKISPWNGRFALPVLLGLALIVSGVIESLITSNRVRHLFLSCLIGLLIGSHNFNTFTFKSAWEKQERFYEQLVWRAPSIDQGTAIIANEEILGYMGDYPTSLAINSMYKTFPSVDVPYWFFAISENFNFNIDEVTQEDQITSTRGILSFQGRNTDAIYITYEPQNGQCLWILRPEDEEYKHLPPNMKKAALISNINNIHKQENTSPLFEQVLDKNKETWCYFYQKSDLARQSGDWKSIIELWQEAQGKNLRPYNGFEFIPFIEAYAQQGQWDEAFELTDRANRTTPAMYFILCPTWERLEEETPFDENKRQAISNVYKKLNCAGE